MTSSRVITAVIGTSHDADDCRLRPAFWPHKLLFAVIVSQQLLLLLLLTDTQTVHSAPSTGMIKRRYCNGECFGETSPPPMNRTSSLDCRGGNMSDVIECRFPFDSTSINLSDRWMAGQLDGGSMRSLASLRLLRILRLDRCNVEAIADLAFSAAATSTNAVADSTTTEGTVRFPALETLRLSDNRISTIGSRAFDGLDNLIELHLDGNRLVALPDDMFGGSDARRCIPVMRRLRVLHLERNRLVELASVAPALAGTSISELHLDENHFRRLSENDMWSSLGDSMRVLTIRGNRQSEGLTVDGAAFSGFRLTWLDLSDSSLVVDAAAAAAAAYLQNIDVETLNLAGNTAIASCIATDGARLSRNGTAAGLEVVSSSFCALHPSVRDVSLSRLELVAVNAHSLAAMSRVTAIDLSSNMISHIEGVAFRPISQLRSLNVAHNRFVRLGHDWGRHLRDLEELIVADNLLTALDTRTFDGMVRLRRLDAAGNRLRIVASELLPVFDAILARGAAIDVDAVRLRTSTARPQSSAAGVDLSRNPFHCNCELKHLRDWIRRQHQQQQRRRRRRQTIDDSRSDGALPTSSSPVRSGYLCSTPEAVADKQLVDVELVCTPPEIVELSITPMTPLNVTTSPSSNVGSSPAVRRVSPSVVAAVQAPSASRPVFRITCSAEGDPPPSVELQSPNGDTFSVIRRSSADDQSRTLPKFRTIAAWKVHVVVGDVHDANRNQSGRFRYTCTATNAAGRAVRTLHVGSHGVEKIQTSTSTVTRTRPVGNFVTPENSAANGSSSAILKPRSGSLAGNKPAVSSPPTAFDQPQSSAAEIANPQPKVTSNDADDASVGDSRGPSSTKSTAATKTTTIPSAATKILIGVSSDLNLTESLLPMDRQAVALQSPPVERPASTTVVSSVNKAGILAVDRLPAAPSTTSNQPLSLLSTAHRKCQLSTDLVTMPTANARSETNVRSPPPSPFVSSTLKSPTETTGATTPEFGEISRRRSNAPVTVFENGEVEQSRSYNADDPSADSSFFIEPLSTATTLFRFRHSKPEVDHQPSPLNAPPSSYFALQSISGATFDSTKNASATYVNDGSVSPSYVAGEAHDERRSETSSLSSSGVTEVMTEHVTTRYHSILRPSDDGWNLMYGYHRNRAVAANAGAAVAVDDVTFAAGAYQIIDVLTESPSPQNEGLTRHYWPAVAVLTVGGIAAIGALVVWRLRACCSRRRSASDDFVIVMKPPTNQVACA